MKTKLLILSGIVLALSSCSNDILTGGGEVNDPTASESTGLATASYIVGQVSQARTRSVDTWTDSHDDSWTSYLDFKLPADYTTVKKDNQYSDNATLKSGNTYYVAPDFDGVLNFENFNGDLYVASKITKFYGNPGNVNLYILESGSWECGNSSGSITIYNKGEVVLGPWDLQTANNIPVIYNGGSLTIGNKDYTPNISNSVKIYSNGEATIEIVGKTDEWNYIDLKCELDIHGKLYVTGNLQIQNSQRQHVCGLIVDGNLYLPQGELQTSYLKANEIKFEGSSIYLLPQAYIYTEKILMPNSATSIVGYDGSYALVETKDIEFQNTNNFMDSFSSNISFKINGYIDFLNSTTFGGQGKHFNSVSEYLEDFSGHENRFNGENLSVKPECGDNDDNDDDDPEKPTDDPVEEPKGPQLIPVISVESPEEGTHDHNSDKGEKGKKRYLSATCIDFDEEEETFYVSYHMRGYNWGNDQYEKNEKGDMSDVEGCIETWKFAKNEKDQTILKLGKYMWTYEFDFNHLIIDGNNIVTVGHKEDKGAIIAKLPNSFADFNPSYEEGELWTSNDLEYKYLTTEEKLYGDVYNKNQGTTTEQWIGYKDAGDGNCVIRVGNEYFVATYAGYGKVNADDFSRVTDDEGKIAFVSTPYSAKHIINKDDGNVAVLYLNDTPEGKNVVASDQSTATLATISEGAFPFNASEKKLSSFVKPVDGKNVIAWNEAKQEMYVCMGKGGLNVNGEIYNFGEDKQEPVNGVAFDEKYIYIASGSHLRALDINTKAEVTSYAIPNMSANYIKLAKNSEDGETYIVVAFGQEGVRVFRLQE